jgi:hypothetical protein
VPTFIAPALSSSTIRVRSTETVARTSLSPRIFWAIDFDPCDSGGSFVFREEIFVDALELHRPAHTHTDVVLRHKLGKTLSVYQDYALSQVANIVDRLGAEVRCRDEDALCGPEPYKAPYEALYIRAAHSGARLVPLSLDVDPVKTEAVFVNHPVNAAVS